MRRRLYALAATLALTVGIVSAATVFGSSGAARQVQEVNVAFREWAIDAPQIVVTAGQPIHFNLSNTAQGQHALTISGQFQEWTSDSLLGGESVTWVTTLDTPGVYQIWCPLGNNMSHRDRGMIGTLTVVAPEAAPVISVPMDLGDFFLDPRTPSLVPAQTVRFQLRNVGMFPHEMVIKGQGEVRRSGPLQPGEQVDWDLTFANGGTYEVYCPVAEGTQFAHKQQGMVGYIDVRAR
jgi:uncharacterized cupredoxin-like copper-binding protein